MVLHVFTSFLGRVPLCIPYGLYSGILLGGTTRGILGEFPGRVLSAWYQSQVSKFLGVLHCCATHPVFCIPF